MKMLVNSERHTTWVVSFLYLQGQTPGITGDVKRQLSVSKKEFIPEQSKHARSFIGPGSHTGAG